MLLWPREGAEQSHRLEHWRVMTTEKYFRRLWSISANSRLSHQYRLFLMHIRHGELYVAMSGTFIVLTSVWRFYSSSAAVLILRALLCNL